MYDDMENAFWHGNITIQLEYIEALVSYNMLVNVIVDVSKFFLGEFLMWWDSANMDKKKSENCINKM